MPTAAERMLELSALPTGNTARAHFLSIVQGTGTIQVFEAIDVELEMADYEVVVDSEYVVQLQESEYQVELEPEEYTVEFC